MSLEGRVALVTGGARGIGRAIALALARAGADVAVGDVHLAPFTGERYYRLRERRSGADEDTPTADAVSELGRRATAVEFDVSDPEQVRRAVAQVESDLGPVDVLANNAGIVNNLGTLSDMTFESWEREVAVNLTGAFNCIQATAPGMAARGWGRIVSISSVAVAFPSVMQPAYTASKAGVIGLTRVAAKTYGPQGVTANAIMPGLIATPLVLSMPAEMRDTFVRATPVGRVGQPADIGSLAAFLSSDEAAFITGVAIPCDGGFVLGPGG